MDEVNFHIGRLIAKQLQGDLAEAEKKELEDWINDSQKNQELSVQMSDSLFLSAELKKFYGYDADSNLKKISALYPPIKHKNVFTIKRWLVAASVLIAVGAGTYFLLNKKLPANSENNVASEFKNDVAPGGNNAILTLANGSKIILDSVHIGKIAQQSGVTIIKTDSGKLNYKALNEKPAEITYNILTTPKGGQYQLQLPDGTKVWLNAASSIKYPTAFIGKERLVEITGEAYFEVVHAAKMPFKVKTGNEMIEDVGTSFNVNAYEDEPTWNTTLLEGAIKINASADLKPGEQGQLNKNGDIKIQENVGLEAVVAWKNGLFDYKSQDIDAVMRQISRWYDVEVIYEGDKPSGHFSGEVHRNKNLSTVLKMLELSNVHFKIEGKKVTVMP